MKRPPPWNAADGDGVAAPETNHRERHIDDP